MSEPSLYNSPRRLFELFKKLTGEDLMGDEAKDKKNAVAEVPKQ